LSSSGVIYLRFSTVCVVERIRLKVLKAISRVRSL
jgi:hypothetical protein